MKFFTVIMPLYNKEKDVARSIQSVLSQTFTNFELLVVNDGSTDSSAQVVEFYLSDERVRLISQKNSGVSAARNLGIEKATSEYVVFFDADDLMHKTHLETLRDMVKKYPEAMVLSTEHNVQEGGIVYERKSHFSPSHIGYVTNPFIVYAKYHGLLNSSTTCVARKILKDDLVFPVGVVKGEDVYLWIKLIEEFGIVHSGSVTVTINRDAENRSIAQSVHRLPEYFYLISDLFISDLVTRENRMGLKLYFTKSAFYTAAFYKINGDKEVVEKFLDLSKKSKFWTAYLLIFSLKLIPSCFVSWYRYKVHSRLFK